MNKIYVASVGWGDEDSQGHVNHSAILRYLAEGRIQLLDKTPRPDDVDYVLVDLKISFLKGIHYPALVTVWGWITKVGKKSITTEYHLTSAGDIVAKAECVNVFFSKDTKQTVEVPEGYRA